MRELNHELLSSRIKTATLEVFSKMLATELLTGEAVVARNAHFEAVGVVSFIGLTGAWSGTGSLSCSPGLACRIASKFMMDHFSEVSEPVLDAYAELTNMVLGNVKNLLEAEVGSLTLTVPTVLFGCSS